jgi:hypothetical protein
VATKARSEAVRRRWGTGDSDGCGWVAMEGRTVYSRRLTMRIQKAIDVE